MRKMICFMLMAMTQYIGCSVFAGELNYSAKSDISDNPFLAYGYNPKTKIISGYLAAFRTTPGRTDECKLVFKGGANRLSVKYLEETWVAEAGKENDSGAALEIRESEPYLKFNIESMGGDCEWILPFKVGKRVSVTVDEVAVTMRVAYSGDWIGVYVVNAKKAKFHSEPDSAAVKKAYLVEGDVIYVYDEKRDWYFVQYDNGKRKTSGWIRKSDTVEP